MPDEREIIEVDNPYDYDFYGREVTDEEENVMQRAIARDRRRQLAQETARQIALVKRMQANGLTVKRATISGVPVEFGQLEAAGEAAPAEEPPRTSLFKARTHPTMKVVL